MLARVLSIPVLLVCLAVSGGAQAQEPATWQVTGVQTGGQLNVRKGPSTGFGIVGRIAHDATGLKNFGCFPGFTQSELSRLDEQERATAEEMTWCRISYKKVFGWVQAQFLVE